MAAWSQLLIVGSQRSEKWLALDGISDISSLGEAMKGSWPNIAALCLRRENGQTSCITTLGQSYFVNTSFSFLGSFSHTDYSSFESLTWLSS